MTTYTLKGEKEIEERFKGRQKLEKHSGALSYGDREFFIYILPGSENSIVALPNLLPMTQHHYYKDQIMCCDLDSLTEGELCPSCSTREGKFVLKCF